MAKKAMKKAVRFVKDMLRQDAQRASRASAIRKICSITDKNLKILRGDLYRVR